MSEGILENVPGIALWASIAASVTLCIFLSVQAWIDGARRGVFSLLSFAWGFNGVLHLFRGPLPVPVYELLRIVWISILCASLLYLLGRSRRTALFCGAGIAIIGGTFWTYWSHELASTIVFPLAFGIMAAEHFRQYRISMGFGSCVLAGFSAANAILSASYYPTVLLGDSRLVILGYAHFALLCLASVLWGWIYLPRELRGRAPVKVPPTEAYRFWVLVGLAEIGTVSGILWFWSWPPILYLASQFLIVGAVLILYFRHRHALVVYAENVTQLLEERTASLRDAQAALARQNELQAYRLLEQEREIREKTSIIERQRRLELAGQTAGEIAHDFQNLISPLIEWTRRICRPETSGDVVREVSEKMKKRVEELVSLNGQLLTLSRRGRLDLHPVSISDLAREIGQRFDAYPVFCQIERDLCVKGSWPQLSRALSNLLWNAVEATEPRRRERGRIKLRCHSESVLVPRPCHLGFLAPGDYVVVEVEDNGPGIPPEILDQVFEPFFSSKSGQGRSGSGLGLSIVNAVVEDHRGIIDLRTGKEGTCFTLYLPKAEFAASEADSQGVSQKVTVGVTEDDSLLREELVQILEEAGYHVIPAESGEEMLQAIQTEPVDLLLIDYKLGEGISGHDLLLGAIHLQPGIKAIVHSSFVSERVALALKTLGASAILTKPAGRSEILLALRQAMEPTTTSSASSFAS